jgi:hypothetical protein
VWGLVAAARKIMISSLFVHLQGKARITINQPGMNPDKDRDKAV